ncbi:hypothetical protein VULLAG_LOCUS12277 [Vulpes lagopus]
MGAPAGRYSTRWGCVLSGRGGGTPAPSRALPAPDSSAAFFRFAANGFRNAVCGSTGRSAARWQTLGPRAAGEGGRAIPTPSPAPQAPRWLEELPFAANPELLWLPAGKSGTSQPPSGNREDSDGSFKTQIIRSVTFSIQLDSSQVTKAATNAQAAFVMSTRGEHLLLQEESLQRHECHLPECSQ